MLFNFFDWVGTFAFAVSGIRLAASKNFDWFGAFIVGLVTAIGGGTLRDMMLNIPLFWIGEPHYFIITFIALIFTIIFKRYLVNINHSIFLFDSMGIALFTIMGIDKALECALDPWVAIVMGVTTACAGGVVRDILINETPLIFRKEIYASACLVGAVLYCVLLYFNVPLYIAKILPMSLIIIIRILAVKFNLNLPGLTKE